MKTFLGKILFPAILIIAVGSLAWAQESVNLKYQMPVGKTYLYKTVQASTITQEMMGKEMKFNNDIKSVTRVKINSVDETGNLSLVVSSDSAIVHNNIQGRDTTLNLDELIGKRSKLVISQYGEVINKSVIDTLSEKEQMMSNAVNQLTTNMYFKLPGRVIKKGENWTFSRSDSVKSMGGEMVVTSNYTYTLGDKEKRNGIDCYQIPYTAVITSSGQANMSGMQFYIDGNGKMKGTIYLSVTDCAMVGIEGNNENKMTLATTGDQKMVIPITQSSTMSTELINN